MVSLKVRKLLNRKPIVFTFDMLIANKGKYLKNRYVMQKLFLTIIMELDTIYNFCSNCFSLSLKMTKLPVEDGHTKRAQLK